MKSCSIILLCIIIGSCSTSNNNTWSRQYTFHVDPGKEDCYYFPDLATGKVLDVDFQVLKSDSKTVTRPDVTVRIISPDHSVIETFELATEGNHRSPLADDGDYAVCVDNKHSTFASKMVYAEIGLENDLAFDYYNYEGDEYIAEDDFEEMRKADFETEYDISVKEIKEKLKLIRHNVGTLKTAQNVFEAHQRRDYNNALDVADRCDLWALIHLGLILITGIFQVIVVKGLFDEKYSVKRFIVGRS